MSQELIDLNAKLEHALANGTAKFTFLKADGTIRTALGTTKLGVVNNFYVFKGGKAKSDKVHPYFDLEKGAWRCYTKSALISIIAAA